MNSEEARNRLVKLKPLILNCSLHATRLGQNAIGAGMYLPVKKDESYEKLIFPSFKCGLITPEQKNLDPEAMIIYFHGGGYVSGGLEYARGFATVLSRITGLRVMFPAYRLAPENKCPTALKDCLTAYRYVLKALEVSPSKLILCGESAGGGLIYSLLSCAREMKLPMPKGIIAISPWTDLTMSGGSYESNKDADPSMTRERLEYFAQCYTDHPEDPLCSPLFGKLTGLPPSLILSGGDEIMLSDSVSLKEKLINEGCDASHIIAEGMWHAYPLYRLTDRGDDDKIILDFVKECLTDEKRPQMDEA